MPDESCRNCGRDLVSYSLCAKCKAVMGRVCVSCGTRTMEQFHDSCVYMIAQVPTIQTHSKKGLFTKIISFD